jgi:hypothetical protein
MTVTIRVSDGLGVNLDSVRRYVTAVREDTPTDAELTAENIHAYIIAHEYAMDMDVADIVDRFKRAVSRHGYNVDFNEEFAPLNLLNATWNRMWVSSPYDHIILEGDRPNDRKTLTAQITAIDLMTWLGTCQDPYSYLSVHLDAQNMHNAEIARVGERAAAIATERQWCNEFDELMENLRADLAGSIVTNIGRFGEREKTYEMMVTVHIQVPVRVSARHDDVARELACDSIREPDVMNAYRNGNYEVTDIEPL